MDNMTKPTKARRTLPPTTILVAAATFLLAACSGDMTAPSRVNKDLVGAQNGTYTWTVNTWQNSGQLAFGASYVQFPANSICNLQTSGYGTAYWNQPCTPATGTITITAVVTGANTNNPSVQFSPAMRFNPNTTVTLLMAGTNQTTLNNMSVVLYCSSGVPSVSNSSCINEALTDPSLVSTVNVWAKTVTRRIKHFSGYLIAEGQDNSINDQ